MCHQGSDSIVVAEPKLIVRNRVVFVDDRDAAQFDESTESIAGMQILCAIDEIMWVEQYLRPDQAKGRKFVVVDPHDSALTDRGDRLERQHVARPCREAQGRNPGGDSARRDDEDLVSGLPELSDFGRQLLDRFVGNRTRSVGDRRRSDLRDDPHVRGRSRS